MSKLDFNTGFYVAIFLPFVIYIYTVCPTIGVGDTAIQINEALHLGINTHVNSHNLEKIFIWLFSYCPFLNIVCGANLVSAFFGSMTIVFFFFAVYQLFERFDTAFITSVFLMISHSMWWHSTIIESYSINAFFTAASLLLYVLLAKNQENIYLYILFFIAGLSMFNHVQMSFFCVGVGICFLVYVINNSKSFWQTAGFSCLSYLFGFLPWIITFLKDWYYSGTFYPTLSRAFFGKFQDIMLQGTWWKGIWDLGFLIIFQAPGIYLLFFPLGIYLFIKKWKFTAPQAGILTHLILNTWFFMFYNTWDKFAFLLPSFVLLFFISSFGVNVFFEYDFSENLEKIAHGAVYILLVCSLIWTVYFYSMLPVWAQSRESFWFARYNNMYTENTHALSEFLVDPNKRGYRDIQRYTELLFKELPENAIYIDDDSRLFYQVQFFQRYYNRRQDLDLRVVNSWGAENWGLSKSEFEAVIKNAYSEGKNLFIVSQKYPFSDFIKSLENSRRYKFKRFPLSDNKWIYKLKTREERFSRNRGMRFSSPALKVFSLPVEFNISKNNVVAHHKVKSFNQDMEGFGAYWSRGEQLFLNSGSGGEIELLVWSDRDIKTRIKLRLTTGSDYGKVSILKGGKQLKSSVDLYSLTVLPEDIVVEDIRLRRGENRIKVKSAGKNKNSKGYNFGIDKIVFLKQEDTK